MHRLNLPGAEGTEVCCPVWVPYSLWQASARRTTYTPQSVTRPRASQARPKSIRRVHQGHLFGCGAQQPCSQTGAGSPTTRASLCRAPICCEGRVLPGTDQLLLISCESLAAGTQAAHITDMGVCRASSPCEGCISQESCMLPGRVHSLRHAWSAMSSPKRAASGTRLGGGLTWMCARSSFCKASIPCEGCLLPGWGEWPPPPARASCCQAGVRRRYRALCSSLAVRQVHTAQLNVRKSLLLQGLHLLRGPRAAIWSCARCLMSALLATKCRQPTWM